MLDKPGLSDRMTGSVEIQAVTSRRHMSEFIKLPRLIYRGMRGFDPPLDHERRQLIAAPNAPFLKSGDAAYWIAQYQGRTVGRISAQMPFEPVLDDRSDGAIGYFGCLDAVDDAAVVAQLISTACEWLSQRGCSLARGPFTLSINGETGLLVSGQESGGMILLPWHPAYLSELVEQSGCLPVKDVVSYSYKLAHRAPFVDWLMQRPFEEAYPDLKVRALDRKDMRGDMEIIRDVYNDAWRNNWGFLPVSADEAHALEKATRDLLVPDCGVIIERNGYPVAAALLLPNLYEIVRGFNGKLLPFNWLKLMIGMTRKRYRSARILLFGVRPSESSKPHGPLLPAMILRTFLNRAPRYNLEEIDMGWILDHRSEIRNMLDRTGAEVTRTHRIYQKVL